MRSPLAAASTQDRVLLLDFDGTVCVGDEPIWAYAESVIAQVAAHSTPLEATAAASRIRSRLSSYLTGAGLQDGRDGYSAVATAAAGLLSDDQLHEAYLSSRRALAEGRVAVSAPPGLPELLRSLGAHTRRILVTNAPPIGIVETLSAIGLTDHLDEIIASAGKPDGWSSILPPLFSGHPSHSIMAVGDFWANDLAVPRTLGCRTALIDRFDRKPGPCDLRGHSFEELYGGIRRWAGISGEFGASPALEATAKKRGIIGSGHALRTRAAEDAITMTAKDGHQR